MDVDSKTGIARRDVSRDGDLWWVSASTVGNTDLGARDVVLRCTSNVEADVLDTEQVL